MPERSPRRGRPHPRPHLLRELDSPKYGARTRQSVLDRDGTLIVVFGEPTGGTALTVRFCQQHGKPYLILDAGEEPPDQAAEHVAAWLANHHIQTLNVAGPRASQHPGIGGYVYRLLTALITS